MRAQVPDQVLCPYERARRLFRNRNALMEDPVEHIAEEKKLRPWVPEEKRIFNEKFLAHPKVPRKICACSAFHLTLWHCFWLPDSNCIFDGCILHLRYSAGRLRGRLAQGRCSALDAKIQVCVQCFAP